MIILFAFANESDQDKFEYLYMKYKNLLLHKAYDVLKDYELAEDAVSEAYIRIYKNLHKIDDPQSNRSIAFAVTIVKNVSLTMLSRDRRFPVEEYDETQPSGFDLEESVLADVSSQQIYEIVEQLGEELRSVFLLRYAYDYSLKEVGSLLNISENNAAVRLHRAKKRLAQIVAEKGYSYE